MAGSLETLLRAAYLMEQKSMHDLKEHMETTQNPDAHARLKEHLLETQWQVKLLAACLEFQNIDANAMDREALGIVDRINESGLFSLKKFEIALYRKIIDIARQQWAPEIVQCCREILEQETAMAEWIEDNYFKMNSSFPGSKKVSA